MNCNELVELVTDFLEGALSSGDEARFRRHLESCAGCRDYVAQMRVTLRLARSSGEMPPPSPVPDALMVAFRDWKRRDG